MSRLSADARSTIQLATCDVPGASIVGYIRHTGDADGKWRGDSCGCPDDRCIGHHHSEGEHCYCLDAVLDEYVCGQRGHVWSDEVREADYGQGPVRWRTCTSCTAAECLVDEPGPEAESSAAVATSALWADGLRSIVK